MAYKRFKIAELGWPSATPATFATLQSDNKSSVARVATVARPESGAAPEPAITTGDRAEADSTSETPLLPATDDIPLALHLTIEAEERAAILEYHAGLSRDEAERIAGVFNDKATASGKLDTDIYTEALKQYGPTSYGTIAVILGWGMTRAGQAETALREAGHIKYDNAGRGRYISS